MLWLIYNLIVQEEAHSLRKLKQIDQVKLKTAIIVGELQDLMINSKHYFQAMYLFEFFTCRFV